MNADGVGQRPYRQTAFYLAGILALSVTFADDIYSVVKSFADTIDDPVDKTFLVIGLSYLGLRMIDALVSVFQGEKCLNPLALSGYLLPFFMVMAGPIGVYRDHVEASNVPKKEPKFDRFVDCVFTISSGYFLKFFVADLYKVYFAGTQGEWALAGPLDTYVFLGYILLEFWGYSLIALGVGRLLGIPTPVNFNHPYMAVSFGEFWTRWHMSLGDFVTRNIYNPTLLFLMRRINIRNKRAVFASNLVALWLPFVFIGLWHHISLNFAIWGIVVGIVVASEKAIYTIPAVKTGLQKALPQWAKRPLGMVYTHILVAVTLSIAIGDF